MRSSLSSAERDSSAELSTPLSSEWKQEANHRLAAHRARRGNRAGLQSALPGMEESSQGTDSASRQGSGSVADRVAARYAKAPTYSEMLAAEARNAARAAEAAAVAAGEARDAAQAILVGLDVDFNEGLEKASLQHETVEREIRHARESRPTPTSPASAHLAIAEAVESEEVFQEEPIAPIQPLPAKLLEFPRELVAARKARPRHAEGPLREDHDRGHGVSQLRIFEVEAETISTQALVESAPPGWSAIRLDAAPDVHAASHSRRDSRSHPTQPAATLQDATVAGFELPLQTASLEDRLMAGIVDTALVIGGFLLFVLIFAGCTAHPPTGKPVLIGAALVFFAFAVIYQLLFFSFGHDTPGMRYAKVALCTFDDENPSRQAMRRRIGALLLSATPLGLGLLWAFFDDDRLGWHDRISRTYQRSYR